MVLFVDSIRNVPVGGVQVRGEGGAAGAKGSKVLPHPEL